MKNQLNKPVVPENIREVASVKTISPPKLFVSAPAPRRSTRLRNKASECILDGANVHNEDYVSIPRKNVAQASVKKVSYPKLLVSDPPPRRSKRLRDKTSECIVDGVNVHNKDSLSIPKKKKKKNRNVQMNRKVSSTLAVSNQSMRSQHRFMIVKIVKDNNSLFRAFAHQLYGKEGLHALIRDRCCSYLEIYRKKFQLAFATELNNYTFEDYVQRMRNSQVCGGTIEITAVSELYKRPVTIYSQDLFPQITISNSVCNNTGISPLRLALDNDKYYSSVVADDHKKTVFVCKPGDIEDVKLYHFAMKVELGFTISPIAEDGNCLFSSFGHQIYGNPGLHGPIRDICCAFMELHPEKFESFINVDTDLYTDYSQYLTYMRKPGIWGSQVEIEALSQIYQRKVEIYDQTTIPRITCDAHVTYNNEFHPIRISFRNRVHYDSVVTNDHGDTILKSADFGKIEKAALVPSTT